MNSISKLLSKLSTSPETSDLECRLLQLPSELREEIWYLSLPRSFPRELYEDEGVDSNAFEGTRSFKLPLWESGNLALLRVNHQVYDEAMPLFWKRNSFTLFVKGADSRLAIGFLPQPRPQTQAHVKPVQHLRLFSSLDPEYSKLIRRWSLCFDTGYSGNTHETVTWEKYVWDSAKRIMPPRITEHALASQYLPHRFITKIATCETDAQSRLSYKHSAFAHLCAFLNRLDFAPTFRYLDLGVGENPGTDLAKESFPAERCQHVYMYKFIEYKPGEELFKLLPQLLQTGTPLVPRSKEDRAWDWLELGE